ncbi:MAG: AtpZ/AtpI family protein [Allosphingosinicella sp.]|uniref:AtpZ/AtpI family protein n=1 Tax=Allosphingosinicella sp. TaxID=2823234 RepID=UPI00394732AE
MAEDGSRQDPASQDRRLTSLEERLRQAEDQEAARTGRSRKPVDANYRLGNQVISYLIGGPAGGALIGWVLDRWFGTAPWLLLVLLFLGMAAGFWNIVKISSKRPD